MRKDSVRLATIHAQSLALPEEAHPCSSSFSPGIPGEYAESNVKQMLELLKEAGRRKADLVCTHEDFKGGGEFLRHLDKKEIFSSLAEEIPGPTSQRLGEVARLYSMHIAANYYEKDRDKIYNTSVLLGRDGGIIGKYRKIHLPASERWRVAEGDEFSVLDTDIGKIGFATCYDIIFPEHCRAVALNGADIIVHQTMGWGVGRNDMGESLVRTRAAENSVYMVVSKNIQPSHFGKSCIIDNMGAMLAEASGLENAVVYADISPDFDLDETGHFNTLFPGVSSVRARQALERMPSLYSVLSEKTPPLLLKYKGIELNVTPGKIMVAFRKWKEYEDAISENKPVDIDYHW